MVETLALVLAVLQGPSADERARYRHEENRVMVTPRVEAWWPAISGRFRQDEVDVFLVWYARNEGTSIDYGSDLGLDSGAPALLPSLTFSWKGTPLGRSGLQKIELLTTFHSAEGSDVLDSDEVVGDSVFPAGAPIESEWRFLRIGAVYGIEDHLDKAGTWHGELGVGLDYVRTEVELESPGLSESEQSADLLMLIKGALDLRVVGPIDVGGSLTLGLGFSSVLAEGALRARVTWGPVSFDLGYRALVWDFDDGDEIVDLKLYGPTAGVSVRF